jgi:hypothetical protein
VILTTSRPFKEWNEVFPKAACIVTLLDRLLHHADVTKIEGDSYREQETVARRRKMSDGSDPATDVAAVVTLYVELPTPRCAPASPINGSPTAFTMMAYRCTPRKRLCSSARCGA